MCVRTTISFNLRGNPAILFCYFTLRGWVADATVVGGGWVVGGWWVGLAELADLEYDYNRLYNAMLYYTIIH